MLGGQRLSSLGRCFLLGVQRRSAVQASCSVIRKADFVQQLWANGLGSTLEIAIGESSSAGSSAGRPPFLWRCSMADLSPPGGPFSQIPGVERVLTLLTGDAELTFEGVRGGDAAYCEEHGEGHTLEAAAAHSEDGETTQEGGGGGGGGGGGRVLEGSTFTLQLLTPFAFSGDINTSSIVRGPGRDLNMMWDRSVLVEGKQRDREGETLI